MGQKVNPTGFRLGISKKQNANWYAKGKDFSTNLIQDLKVREYFKTKLKTIIIMNTNKNTLLYGLFSFLFSFGVFAQSISGFVESEDGRYLHQD